MIIEDGLFRFELAVRTEGPWYGDGVAVRVAASHAGFAGASDETWVDRAALEQFAADLAAFERTRRGEATLVGYAFRLRVFSTDRSGHLAVQCEVERPSGAAPAGVRDALSCGAAVDPGRLPGIV